MNTYGRETDQRWMCQKCGSTLDVSGARFNEPPTLNGELMVRVPTYDELLRMAEKHPPPQEWFDDTTDPTEPE